MFVIVLMPGAEHVYHLRILFVIKILNISGILVVLVHCYVCPTLCTFLTLRHDLGLSPNNIVCHVFHNSRELIDS